MATEPQVSSSHRWLWVVVVALAAVLGGLGVAVWREFKRSYVVEQRAGEVKREVAKLEANRQALAKFFAALQNPETIEREAKVQLNLRRPDEQVVVIVPSADQIGARPEGQGSTAAPAQVPEITARAPSQMLQNALAWWEYFFGGR